MENSKSESALFELISAANLIDRQELEEHSQVSKFMGIPLSNVLAKEGKIPCDFLKLLIRLADLIDDESISAALALSAIYEMLSGFSSIEELLLALDAFSSKTRLCKLGELLIDAGIVNQINVGMALWKSSSSKQKLGEILLEQKLLSPAKLFSALQLQAEVRSYSLDYHTAVGILAGNFRPAYAMA